MKFEKKLVQTGIIFIFPALITYTLFMVLPILGTVGLSFFKWSGYNFSNITWNGINNYMKMLNDRVFWISLQNNLKLIAFIVPLQCLLGLIAALLLERGLKFSTFFRGIYFFPNVVPFVVSGIIITMLLNPSLGIGSMFQNSQNSIIKYLSTIDWLGNPRTALGIIALIRVWTGFGYSMFLFIAKLKTIPGELYEAATVDGASEKDKLIYITLPQLKNTLKLVIILASIDVMKVFTVIFVTTNGGPNYSTHALSTWTYFQAFQLNNVGYGSTVATVLLILTLGLTVVQLKIMKLK